MFDTTIENIPAKVPYITLDRELVHKWAEKMPDNKSKLKVGLVWAGRQKHVRDRYRSCSLDTFAPLGELEDITFYSFQKGKAGEQAKNPPSGMIAS
jgi:hypothetical protein